MTIYEIKRLSEQNAQYFFDRKTLKYFGQTLRDFKVYKRDKGKFLISAPIIKNGKICGHTERLFNTKTNELEHI